MAIADSLNTIAENVPKVYEAGKKAEYDAFWDALQDYGDRDYYYYGFAYRWNDDCYNPKYPIVCGGTTVNSANGNALFRTSPITDTKVDVTILYNAAGAFYGCTKLKTIRKLIVTETTSYSNTFYQCSVLENIVIEGTIGKEINFGPCKNLTHDSLMSIINALKDGVSSITCTLGTTNLEKLTDEEKAIATQKGWDLA